MLYRVHTLYIHKGEATKKQKQKENKKIIKLIIKCNLNYILYNELINFKIEILVIDLIAFNCRVNLNEICSKLWSSLKKLVTYTTYIERIKVEHYTF